MPCAWALRRRLWRHRFAAGPGYDTVAVAAAAVCEAKAMSDDVDDAANSPGLLLPLLLHVFCIFIRHCVFSTPADREPCQHPAAFSTV
jgi:hypothetical protein